LWKDTVGNVEEAGVIIPEKFEQCKYLDSNGLGNEDGVMYIECSCTQSSIKFLCSEE
jgi:hypothetical protein